MQIKTAIDVKDFSFSYGKQQVLQDLSLQVDMGSVHGIVGPNGTGKSTLFNCLFSHHRFPEITIQPGLEKEIAYLQSDTYFYPYMTGMEYLSILSKKKDKRVISHWNQIFELPLQEYIHHYSTGMKKKVALLGVMLLDKQILLLDEPTNGLDLDSCESVYLILERLQAKDKTILISSHIFETLTSSCDRITLMKDGAASTYEQASFPDLEKIIKCNYQEKYELLLDELMPL